MAVKITIRPNGPYLVEGETELVDVNGNKVDTSGRGPRFALCRCGASRRKPYCDGSHEEVGFDAPAAFAVTRVEPAAAAAGTLTVIPADRGPLLLRGPVAVEDAAGEVGYRGERASFCRCGASSAKPFCDASHHRIGFAG